MLSAQILQIKHNFNKNHIYFDHFLYNCKKVITILQLYISLVMHRYLLGHFARHLQRHRQMLFLSGPRQVGKTTAANAIGELMNDCYYFSWDSPLDRKAILEGPHVIAQQTGADRITDGLPLCIFDELHKFQHWRDFLKGMFDTYESNMRFLVAGSASLQVFSRGGDSLLGRYFPYTLHPVSVAECTGADNSVVIDSQPKKIDEDQWDSLWNFGGFPEPFLLSDKQFHEKWLSMRAERLLREDLRDLTRIQELGQIEYLALLLRYQVGQLTSYSSLARKVQVQVNTIKSWIATLKALYYCFEVKPWHANVARALRKEPKYYLWDWSAIEDSGARAENFVASALFKAVHWWTNTGQGQFDLHFVRDKQKNEVDFLVSRNRIPWFLVNVKTSKDARLSKSLQYFQKQTNAEHAFQVAMDLDFVERNCFEFHEPVIAPARTLLAQLV